MNRNTGRRDGKGKLWLHNGSFFEGYFNDGAYVQGRLTYPNGEVYEGNFLGGQAHGYGTMWHKNGEVVTGKWRNN